MMTEIQIVILVEFMSSDIRGIIKSDLHPKLNENEVGTTDLWYISTITYTNAFKGDDVTSRLP